MGRSQKREPERITSEDVQAITGLTLRTVQNLADRRIIPSAAKLGGRWMFDEQSVRRWIRLKEAEECEAQKNPTTPTIISTGSKVWHTSRSKSEENKYEKAFEQQFGRRRGKPGTKGSRN